MNEFNWGAYFGTWIWGLFNKSYKTLWIIPLGLTPLGAIYQLVCGLKGNEWAWQNKRWESIEHFHAVQKKWACASLIYVVVLTLLAVGLIFAILLPINMANSTGVQHRTMAMKSISTIMQATLMNETSEVKTEPTSIGLATSFAKNVNVVKHIDNVVETVDGITWSFVGNGRCKNIDECYVSISDENGFYETIPLTVENGYMKAHCEDVHAKYAK